MLAYGLFGILIAAGLVLGVMMFVQPARFRNKKTYIISRALIIGGVVGVMIKTLPAHHDDQPSDKPPVQVPDRSAP